MLGDKYISEYRGIKRMFLHVFREKEALYMAERAGFTILRSIALSAVGSRVQDVVFARGLRSSGYIIVCQKGDS